MVKNPDGSSTSNNKLPSNSLPRKPKSHPKSTGIVKTQRLTPIKAKPKAGPNTVKPEKTAEEKQKAKSVAPKAKRHEDRLGKTKEDKSSVELAKSRRKKLTKTRPRGKSMPVLKKIVDTRKRGRLSGFSG